VYTSEDASTTSRDREECSAAEKLAMSSSSSSSTYAFGTASALGGVNFFHEMIDVLTSLLLLRHSLEPAAADAALALWALAWQPSNRTHMVTRVTAKLATLAREGCETSRDDALSVLSVLALDEEGRAAILAQSESGKKLLEYLMTTSAEANSPRTYDAQKSLGFDALIERGESSADTGGVIASAAGASSSTSLSFAVSRMMDIEDDAMK
jgi:hypothetical protein